MSRLKSSRNSGFSSRVGYNPAKLLPNLGQLDTLRGYKGGPGHAPRKKKSKFEVIKLLEIH